MIRLFSASADVIGRRPVRIFNAQPSVMANVKMLEKRLALNLQV